MASIKSVLPTVITFFLVYLLIYLFAPAAYLGNYILSFEAYDYVTFIVGFSRAPFLLNPGYELSTILTWLISGVVLGYLSKKTKRLIANGVILIVLFLILSQLNIFLYSFSINSITTNIQQWVIPALTGLFIMIVAGLVGVSLSGESSEEIDTSLTKNTSTSKESYGAISPTPKVEEVISTKVCPHCGSVISSTVTYCPYCGKKV